MGEVLEYISLNYIWFLIGAIIIVLAIIGHYAEKSNFGQGKSANSPLSKKEDKKIKLEQLTLKDLINKNNKDKTIDELESTDIKEIFSENSLEDTQENQPPLDNTKQEQDSESNLGDKNSNNSYIDEVTEDLFSSNDSNQTNSIDDETYNSNNIEKSSDSTKTREDEFKDFDKEFDMIVPKKDIMNEGILEDIEDLSLDNTQVFNKEEIPDLDNIDLPEIRDVNLSENDIWK